MITSMSKDGLVTIPLNASDAYHMGYAQGYADGRSAAPRWVRCEEEHPKSGTHVLACCEVHGIGGYRSRYVCDAFHTDAKSIPCQYSDDIDSEYDEETDEYYFPEGWWEVIKNWDDYSCVAINDFVTHWMPLPEPPQEVQDGPIITPCRGCSDYDGYGGCKSKGGCARAKMEVQE